MDLEQLWYALQDGDVEAESLLYEAQQVSSAEFGLENLDFSAEFGIWDDTEAARQSLVGWQEWAGRPFIGGQAGGDWEYPVYFIVYLKDGDLTPLSSEHSPLKNLPRTPVTTRQNYVWLWPTRCPRMPAKAS